MGRLSKAQITDVSLKASLAPAQDVTTTPLLKPSAFSILYKKAIVIITKIPIAVYVGLVLGAGYLLYSIAVKYTSITNIDINRITLIIIILLLTTIGFMLPQYKKKYPKCQYEIKPEYQYKIKYEGEATLPKKVYVGNSHSITLNLKPTFSTLYSEESFRIQDSESGKFIVLQIQRDSNLETFLEIQLLAAGLVVDGDKMQRQGLTLSPLAYNWNCYFPNSGDHVLSLIIRVGSQSNAIELGTIQHSVKVAQLDHLTQRQVQMAGIITGGLAIAISLQQLGVLQKIIFYISP